MFICIESRGMRSDHKITLLPMALLYIDIAGPTDMNSVKISGNTQAKYIMSVIVHLGGQHVSICKLKLITWYHHNLLVKCTCM